VRDLARTALAAPIGQNDAQGARLLVQAGADPNNYVNDAGEPGAVLHEAVRTGNSAELVELLLAHGARPDEIGPDGRSPYAVAVSLGRTDLADLLRRYGAPG
jgi:uncharacterized protein